MSSTDTNIRPRRSFIFTPGLRPDMFPKALASGADIVCVELEDGIAPKDKAEARSKALAKGVDLRHLRHRVRVLARSIKELQCTVACEVRLFLPCVALA